MPRLFFPGAIGDIQRLQVRYASECKVPNERGNEKLSKKFASQHWYLVGWLVVIFIEVFLRNINSVDL